MGPLLCVAFHNSCTAFNTVCTGTNMRPRLPFSSTDAPGCWWSWLLAHVHVPIVQSNAPSDDPSDCAGHAMAVSSQRSSVAGRDDCTRCPLGAGYLLAWLDRSFCVNRRFAGRKLGVVQKHVSWRSVKTVRVARFRAHLAEKHEEFHGSWEVGASGCARLRPARWQRGGQRNHLQLVSKSARSISGRWHHCLRISFDHLMMEGELEESLPKRRAASALAAWQSHLTALGKFLKSWTERPLHLDEDVEVNDAQVVYPNDCSVPEVQHHHGSQLLAANIDRWLSSTRFGSNRLPRNHLRLTKCIRIFCFTCMRPSELVELKQSDVVPPFVRLHPGWAIVIAAHGKGGFARTDVRDGVEIWKSGSVISITLQRRTGSKHKARHSGTSARFQNYARSSQGQWIAFIVARCD